MLASRHEYTLRRKSNGRGEKIMADPVIYGPAFSTYVRSVLLTLEEKAAPYR